MGYDIDRFVGEVNDGLLCAICRDVLEDPLQAPDCEHAFCGACIDGWLVHDRGCCPEDRQPLLAAQLRPLQRYMRNDLNRCRYAEDGCENVCVLEQLQQHETSHCEYRAVPCSNTGCTVVVRQRDIEFHLSVCERRAAAECSLGCGYVDTCDGAGNSITDGHSCFRELRKIIENTTAELSETMRRQREDTELRLEAQRRYMVGKEETVGALVESLRLQLVTLAQESAATRRICDVNRTECDRLARQQNELSERLTFDDSNQDEPCLCSSNLASILEPRLSKLEQHHHQTMQLLEQKRAENEELRTNNQQLSTTSDDLIEQNRKLKEALENTKCSKCRKKQQKAGASNMKQT